MAIQNSLDTLKSAIRDYARPNRFDVEFQAPSSGQSFTLASHLIKSLTYPALQLGLIPISHLGHSFKLPGDSLAGELTVVMRVDADYEAFKYFREWMYSVFPPAFMGDKSNPDADATGYLAGANITVSAYDLKFKKIWKSKFLYCFPTIIDPLAFDMDAVDSALETSITFTYSGFEKEA